MKTVFYVRVNGRVFETTESEARRDELLELLPMFYQGAEVTVEQKCVRERKVRR